MLPDEHKHNLYVFAHDAMLSEVLEFSSTIHIASMDVLMVS